MSRPTLLLRHGRRAIERALRASAVVMVTAEAVYANVVAAPRGGADDFLGKPVNVDELRFILQRVIAAKQQGIEIEGDPRMLIVSDTAERIPHLQEAFPKHQIEVTSVVFPEEWVMPLVVITIWRWSTSARMGSTHG